MKPTHFITEVQSNGQLSWTLTTRLGEMLSRAENLYRQRDTSWTILGIEFGPGPPMIWYPGHCKHIAIRLALNALNDDAIAQYQLAHECVHLLAPTGQADAPVLEEGLATVFAEDCVTRTLTDGANYIRAAAAVRELLMCAPDAILALRDIEPSFAKMNPETFVKAGVKAPQPLLNELLSKFVRN